MHAEMSNTNKRSSNASFNTASFAEHEEQNRKQFSKLNHQQDKAPSYFRKDDEHESEVPHQASTLMRLQVAREDRRQGSQLTGQRKGTAGKSCTAAAAGKSKAALNKNALKNRRWRQRKKLKLQQVEEDLVNAELEREQLKNEQTRLREKMIVLLNQHQTRLGRTGGSVFAQAAASSAYGPDPLPPRVARNTAPLDEPARAEGVANFCGAGLQEHELDHATNSVLISAYQQQSHTTKEKDQRKIRMSYAAAAVIAQERIKNIANYQQYPAAGPSNLVASQNQHEQEYRAAAAFCMRQLMAQQQQRQQQQQFTNPLSTVPPPPQLQPDAHMHGRNLSNVIHGGVGRLPPILHQPPIFNSLCILPFMQSFSGRAAPFEFAPPAMVMSQDSSDLARKKDEASSVCSSQNDAAARRDQVSNSSEDGADDMDQKPRAA
jgi:hypothetical protein